MVWVWVVLGILGIALVITMITWIIHSRRKEAAHSAPEPPQAPDSPDPLDLQPFPTMGVLVPAEPVRGGISLRVLLEKELALSDQTAPFALRYRMVPADLLPHLGAPSHLRAGGALAQMMRDLSTNLRGQAASTSLDTLTLFRSDLDASQLVNAAGGGYRGYARDSRHIRQQARLKPVAVPRDVVEGTRSIVFKVGKGGLVITGLTISWPALLMTAGFVALDAMNQAQRRDHERRIESFIHRTDRRSLEERIATQRKNHQGLNRYFSLLLDQTDVGADEIIVLQDSINREFELARVVLQRIQNVLDRHNQGKPDTKALITELGLEEGTHVVNELLHARGALDQQRRSLLLSEATEVLRSSRGDRDHRLEHLRNQLNDVEEANQTLQALVDSLRKLELTTKNPLGKRKLKGQRDSLQATLTLAFPVDEASEGSILTTFAVDDAGNVFQIDPTVDVDAVVRRDLERRLHAAASKLLYLRQQNETLPPQPEEARVD